MSAHIDRFVRRNALPSIQSECHHHRDNTNASTPFNRILECKTANPFATGEWGEAGTDQIPMSYLCQCIWYMAITEIGRADLAVLFGNHDFRIYEITKDVELENLVIQKAEHFWHQYVLKDIPPPTNNEQDCQILFNKGDSTKTIQGSHETLGLTKRLHFLNSEIATYEKEISGIKQVIMNQMGAAETLAFEDEVLATWKSPKPSNRLDTKKLELEHPELCANYKVPIQNSRRLVIKELSNSIETLSDGS
jgi:predicted phage-related endonuclease